MNPDANFKVSVDAAQLKPLFPDTVVLRSGSIRDCFASLADSEQSLLTRAVASRRAEFSTGRMLAADGLRQLGIETFPLKRGSCNEPLWPPGVVGSISHSSGVCVVVLGRSNAMEFVGVDIESRTGNVEKIGDLVLTDDERQYQTGLGAASFDDWLRVIFCAKEAIYKAIFPSVARFVDFREVSVGIDGGSSTFTARAGSDRALDTVVRRGTGRFLLLDSVLIASFFCEAVRRGQAASEARKNEL